VAPSVARVDLTAIRHNLAVAKTHSGAAAVCAIVKADAYGHGAVAVARALEPEVASFGVATVEEGAELREAGIHKPILALFGGRDMQAMVHYGLTPTLACVEDLDAYARALEGRPGRFTVGVDTGMTRTGLLPANLEGFLGACRAHRNLRLVGLQSHLSSSWLGDRRMNGLQIERFEACRAALHALGFGALQGHLANSVATLRMPEAHYEMVRPGLLLYGYDPEGQCTTLRPALSWVTQPVRIQAVPKGTRVSYGGTWTAPRDSVIATLPVGYADGYPRHLSNKGEVCIGGRRAKVVGIVCMDLCMVDVTDIAPLTLDTEVVLLGDTLPATLLAAWCDTIPYEILCGLGRRVQKSHVG
jgi:alanine racemase